MTILLGVAAAWSDDTGSEEAKSAVIKNTRNAFPMDSVYLFSIHAVLGHARETITLVKFARDAIVD